MICSYLLLFYLILADSSFYVYFSTFSYNMCLSYLFVCWLVASVIVACSLFYIIYALYIVIFIYVIFMSVCLVLLIYFIHCIIVIMFIALKSNYSVYYYYTARIRNYFTLLQYCIQYIYCYIVQYNNKIKNNIILFFVVAQNHPTKTNNTLLHTKQTYSFSSLLCGVFFQPTRGGVSSCASCYMKRPLLLPHDVYYINSHIHSKYNNQFSNPYKMGAVQATASGWAQRKWNALKDFFQGSYDPIIYNSLRNESGNVLKLDLMDAITRGMPRE